MNRAFSYIITVIVSVGLTLIGDMAARAPKISVPSADHITNAAFRDGSYQARLDVENGRKPHLSSGRWRTDEDRASYIAGYRHVYPQFLPANAEKMAAAAPAELNGYRDGINDGTHDQKKLQPFQLAKTEHHRSAGGLPAGNQTQQTSQLYRQGYANGYQEGYYSENKYSEVRTVSAAGKRF